LRLGRLTGWLGVFLFACNSGSKDDTTDPDTGTTFDWNPASIELCDLVNEHRVENGLEPIPVSPALMAVGEAHVVDWAANSDGIYRQAGCNLHSWSDTSSDYTGCCYTSDHAEAECMWRKPAELTASWEQPFHGTGFENAAVGHESVEGALAGWKTSPEHNDVILNLSGWSDSQWLGLGCGADEQIAAYYLWFSDGADPNIP